MSTAYLSLGSNLGDKQANIKSAIDRLSTKTGIQVTAVSSLYRTAPVDFLEQPDFINAVVRIETALSPYDLLKTIQKIEHEMGRVRTERWSPRIIDIDILLFGEVKVDTPELTIPHPRMMSRAFVMYPLAEIAPDLVLPGGRKPNELLSELRHQEVNKVTEVT